MSVPLTELQRLYAGTDDPWDFDGVYEQAKFAATADALSRDAYDAGFEIGCGNGALAQHLAPRCGRYVGMDAVERAIEAARRRVPEASFIRDLYPCPLPNEEFDLIVLSEFLYFLGAETIRDLAADIEGRWPTAELILVTYLGDTAHSLQGEETLAIFTDAATGHRFEPVRQETRYRIDRGLPK
ncbi:nodulation S family protein [Paracoccus sp. TK19116]|uniref:Nodulation S family protein n=1 Tax=Paracoccus albicereus TaxID=2922394 RepID=A0ABT1MMU5_9RHOB|nr:class I SAM-dependent methyltransferase [Paracoccus albicereus]MCQ0969587.1 nodulation S family protein [Paracoccus albicereus]